jgi:CBS domain-containing protein
MEGSGVHIRWMSVENAMTKEVTCVKSSERVRDAWLILMEKDISGAPVLDESGALVGVLSVTDIYRAIVDRVLKAKALREATRKIEDPAEEDKEELREMSLAIRAVNELAVSALLPKEQKLFVLGPFDSVERAIRLMAENNVNRLPVVKDGRVIGIITRQDIIHIVSRVR